MYVIRPWYNALGDTLVCVVLSRDNLSTGIIVICVCVCLGMYSEMDAVENLHRATVIESLGLARVPISSGHVRRNSYLLSNRNRTIYAHICLCDDGIWQHV